MLNNKEIWNLFTRMQLNSDSIIDNDFLKSIKFTVDEFIENDCPKTIICESFHDMMLQAYKLYLNDKLHSIGIIDRQNNYNGTTALDMWLDTPTKNRYQEMNNEIEMMENRLLKLEKLVKKFNLTDEQIDEYIKEV
jgi:hypothetical protein